LDAASCDGRGTADGRNGSGLVGVWLVAADVLRAGRRGWFSCRLRMGTGHRLRQRAVSDGSAGRRFQDQCRHGADRGDLGADRDAGACLQHRGRARDRGLVGDLAAPGLRVLHLARDARDGACRPRALPAAPRIGLLAARWLDDTPMSRVDASDLAGSASTLRGAGVVARTLESQGIRRVFRVSGNHIMPIYDALLDTDIEIVHARHEAACMHMADAHGRLTGQPGIALVNGGQGHANGAAGLFTALAAESPMVLLSGHAPCGELGRGAFQEMSQAEIARPTSKASWTANTTGSLGADICVPFGLRRTVVRDRRM